MEHGTAIIIHSMESIFTVENVNLSPRPVQQPHPPMWTAAMSKVAAKRAAKFNCHVAGTGGERKSAAIF